MIPTFASGAGIGTGIISPSASLISTGYVAGQTLAAQHLNYYLWGITAELNSILTEAGIAPILNQSNQILNAIKAIITNFVNLFWQPALASGNNSAFMALLSAASASVLGIAKVDNLTIQSAAGVLSLIQSAGAYAPMPQSAAGVGQFYPINSGSGGSLADPTGRIYGYTQRPIKT